MDKGAHAPCLNFYGSAFEVQLNFEVDEALHLRSGQESLEGPVSQSPLFPEPILKLCPPSEQEVTDVFSMGWLTWCFQRLWRPFVEKAIKETVLSNIEPLIKQSVPQSLGCVHFSSFKFGEQTPEFGPIFTSWRSGVRGALQLDIAVKYKADSDIKIEAGLTQLGVTQVSLTGTLTLLFDPIVQSMPIIGGMHMFFLNPPSLTLQFAGLAGAASNPFLQRLMQSAMDTAIAESFVLPNVLTMNWMPDRMVTGDPTCWMSSILPIGAVRIAVINISTCSTVGSSQKQRTLKCMCGQLELNQYAMVHLGILEHRLDFNNQDFQNSAGQNGCEMEIACSLLVYDVKQTVQIDVWQQDVPSDYLLGRSKPLELHQLLRSSSDQGTCIKLQSSEESEEIEIQIKLVLYELHADKWRLKKTRQQQPEGAILICKVMMGRLPDTHPSQEYELHLRVGDSNAHHFFTPRDTNWKDYVKTSEPVEDTVEALMAEGLTTMRIAEVLQMEEPLVAKIAAYRNRFNAELLQNLCILVHPQEVNNICETGILELEVRHRGHLEASGKLDFKLLWMSEGLRLQRLIELSPETEYSGQTYDLEMEFRLLAFVPHHGVVSHHWM